MLGWLTKWRSWRTQGADRANKRAAEIGREGHGGASEAEGAEGSPIGQFLDDRPITARSMDRFNRAPFAFRLAETLALKVLKLEAPLFKCGALIGSSLLAALRSGCWFGGWVLFNGAILHF